MSKKHKMRITPQQVEIEELPVEKEGLAKALELIRENKITKDKFLDLGNLGLRKIPNSVFGLRWLEHLCLGDVYFDTQLKAIHFSNNTGKLNSIKFIPDSIGRLTQLKGLYLRRNKLRKPLKISSIFNLRYLSLGYNNFHDPYFLTDFHNLTFLEYQGGHVFDISFIENMKNLEFLHLGENKIFEISSITKTPKLKALGLHNNNVENIDVILELQYLEYAFFMNNKISKLPKELFNRHLEVGISQKSPISVVGNPIEYPPIEFIKQGNSAVKSYLQYLDAPKPLNQLKTLLVGDGLSGKTSLLKQILQLEFDYHEPQTHGIHIHPSDIEINGESIHVKFWDFGGQEIMHGTHTFFYSKRSIYLLVLDARREGKEDYWLKHIESFGGDSPVLVVLNKIDENPSFDVNRAFLQNKYPNIVGFVRVSCKTGDGIDRLVQELEKQIHALEMRRTPFAKSWFEVKEALDTMGEDYISYDRYYALCREKEVTDETAQNVLLQFLHDLGIVLAFRNLELHDTQVINPLWLTNAVYRIINSKLVAGKKGYLHLSDLDAILNDPTYAHEGFKYPRNKFLYIVKIMQEFELCYRIAEEVFIVPDLLTVEEQPVPGFDYDTALRFVLQYDFLPASVLPRFMVQLHTRIVEGEQWRTGTALEDPIFKAKAVVKADRDEKRLYLWVNGPDRDSRRNFFNFIRKTLHDIHDSFEKLTVTELVPVPGHDDIFIEYAELVGYEEVGEKEYLVGKLRRRFNVGEMLSGLEAPERRQPRRHAPVKVFVSYSHKDAEYKEELVTALAYLSRMEEIELWQDGRIEAGMEWRKEIFEKLAEAELVICLVSSEFIASDFCWKIELQQALDAHKQGEKIVFPIQIKPSGWQKTPLGEVQGVPSKPISQFAEHSDGWGEIFNQMEAAIKRLR